MKSFDNMGLKQVERRVKPLRKVVDNTKVKPCWINYIRRALGMTVKNLAKRAELSPSGVFEIEKREETGSVTIKSLRGIAEAMDCELIYAFVPKKSISSIIEENAYKKAKDIVLKANTHMELEDQKVQSSLEERVKILAKELIESGKIW